MTEQAVLDDIKPSARIARLLESLGRRALIKRLSSLREGRIELEDETGRVSFGESRSELRASLRVHDPAFYSAVLTRGSVGAGESFARGEWSSDDFVSALRILLRNRSTLEGIESGLARLSAPLLQAWHRARANSRAGSRRNIAAHYDLGNDFFEQVLDPSMTYSCGLFLDADSTLHEASTAKLDRACRRLGLGPEDHLLEIGTGWGSMALHAAQHFGCRVTTTTISREQHDYAKERIARAGLEDRVEVLLSDYRDLDGQYDKLVSIEMIEAVGHAHLDRYFQACAERLKPGGLMLLQAIRISDQHHDEQLRSPDFIKRHVFPGSHIPSLTTLSQSLTRATDMRIVELFEMGLHYARTLSTWRASLLGNRAELSRLGYGETLLRGFEYYLGYCEAGFAESYLGTMQLVLTRPGARIPSSLGNGP